MGNIGWRRFPKEDSHKRLHRIKKGLKIRPHHQEVPSLGCLRPGGASHQVKLWRDEEEYETT
jgi:hypothetical protein